MTRIRRWWSTFVAWIKPYITWKMFPIFVLAWMITNGWAYAFIVIGPLLRIPWMTAVGTAYAAFLWMPFTPEKIVTFAISGFLYRLIYREDFKKENES